MTDTTLYTLVNGEFTFHFAGKDYTVRKASLDKAVQYQQKAKELSTNPDPTGMDLKLAAFCIYLILKDKDPEITEQFVLENTPGDIDVLECLTTLGFISQKKAETTRLIEEAVVKKVTS
jgi:hypothetical protein